MKARELTPMKPRERILGCLYIPFHGIVLPFGLSSAFILLGVQITAPGFLLIHYALSFLLVLTIMFSFLRESFSAMCGTFGRVIIFVLLSLLLYNVLLLALAIFMSETMMVRSPNTEAVHQLVESNRGIVIAVAVVLAPIIEEAIFRGALFGAIRGRSRLLAYIVSALVFGLYHLALPMLLDLDWSMLRFVVHYLPASIALAWCYERTGTIWAPIILHAVINLWNLTSGQLFV